MGTISEMGEIPKEIRVRAVLTDLSAEQLLRFFQHLRRWDDSALAFVDEEPGGLEAADDEDTVWALPLIFLGRYDREEDDSVGETFFDHPIQAGRGDRPRVLLARGLRQL